MKVPQPRNAPITQARMSGWVALFSSYRSAISEHAVQAWLAQFDENDRNTAARVLDAVEFVPVLQIAAHYRQLLLALPGWHANPQQRVGRWVFSAFSSSAGESGDSMLHRFRLANNLGGKANNELFKHRSELLTLGLGPNDSIVFVDDFSGSGDQAVEAWDEYFHELVPPDVTLYLILVAASMDATNRIAEETDLTVSAGFFLSDQDNIFHDDCIHFSINEKARILHYCSRASRLQPKGHSDCGFLIVFSHNCPDNSIAMLHNPSARWVPLFPRHDS